MATTARLGEPTADRVRPDDLNVAPALLGLPLARPAQRAQAMAVDLAAIAALSWLANGFWLAGLGVLLWLRHSEQKRGVRTRRRLLAAALALPLMALGLQHTLQRSAPEAAETEPAAAATQPASAPPPALGAASAAASATAAPVREQALQATVATLEAQLAALKAEQDATPRGRLSAWRERLAQGLEEAGLGYGWSILYFTLLPAWWGGRTLGKALLGLQVRELTGKPMTPLLALKRYGGYAAGMATGGLGLVQLLWDTNRQGLQDKTAHTVVVDLRRATPPATADRPRP